MDDDTPPTDPSGSLVPPAKPPTTALATAFPPPEPRRHPRHPSSFGRPFSFTHLVRRTMDAVDELADAVAEGLGLRHP